MRSPASTNPIRSDPIRSRPDPDGNRAAFQSLMAAPCPAIFSGPKYGEDRRQSPSSRRHRVPSVMVPIIRTRRDLSRVHSPRSHNAISEIDLSLFTSYLASPCAGLFEPTRRESSCGGPGVVIPWGGEKGGWIMTDVPCRIGLAWVIHPAAPFCRAAFAPGEGRRDRPGDPRETEAAAWRLRRIGSPPTWNS
jgi:hypothetical protein